MQDEQDRPDEMPVIVSHKERVFWLERLEHFIRMDKEYSARDDTTKPMIKLIRHAIYDTLQTCKMLNMTEDVLKLTEAIRRGDTGNPAIDAAG